MCPPLNLSCFYVLYDPMSQLGRCNIVDTLCHASGRSDTTKANKAPFLLYGGKVQVLGLVLLKGRLKVLNLVCLWNGGQGGNMGRLTYYRVMTSFCCKGLTWNRWGLELELWALLNSSTGNCACVGLGGCGLIADGLCLLQMIYLGIHQR